MELKVSFTSPAEAVGSASSAAARLDKAYTASDKLSPYLLVVGAAIAYLKATASALKLPDVAKKFASEAAKAWDARRLLVGDGSPAEEDALSTFSKAAGRDVEPIGFGIGRRGWNLLARIASAGMRNLPDSMSLENRTLCREATRWMLWSALYSMCQGFSTDKSTKPFLADRGLPVVTDAREVVSAWFVAFSQWSVTDKAYLVEAASGQLPLAERVAVLSRLVAQAQGDASRAAAAAARLGVEREADATAAAAVLGKAAKGKAKAEAQAQAAQLSTVSSS
jgi:hypothetical protein